MEQEAEDEEAGVRHLSLSPNLVTIRRGSSNLTSVHVREYSMSHLRLSSSAEISEARSLMVDMRLWRDKGT